MSAPGCECPDRLAAGTPTRAVAGWYMLVHVERAYAEAHGRTPMVDSDGSDYAVNVRVRFCPFCGVALREVES